MSQDTRNTEPTSTSLNEENTKIITSQKIINQFTWDRMEKFSSSSDLADSKYIDETRERIHYERSKLKDIGRLTKPDVSSADADSKYIDETTVRMYNEDLKLKDVGRLTKPALRESDQLKREDSAQNESHLDAESTLVDTLPLPDYVALDNTNFVELKNTEATEVNKTTTYDVSCPHSLFNIDITWELEELERTFTGETPKE